MPPSSKQLTPEHCSSGHHGDEEETRSEETARFPVSDHRAVSSPKGRTPLPPPLHMPRLLYVTRQWLQAAGLVLSFEALEDAIFDEMARWHGGGTYVA